MKSLPFLASLGLCLALHLTAQAQVVLSVDINDRDNTGITFPGFDPLIVDAVGGTTAIQNAPTVRMLGALTVTLEGVGDAVGYDDRLRATPADSGAFTQSLLLRDFIFSRDTNNGGLNITVDGLTANTAYKVTVWSFDSGSTGNRISDWFANGTSVRANYLFNGSTLPTSDTNYQFSFSVFSTPGGQLLVQGRRVAASATATFGVFLNALKVEVTTAAPPTIVSQPSPVGAYLGDNLTFSVQVQGVAPFAFQWRKDGVPIDDATNRTFTIPSVQASDAGAYSVVVSNPAGSTPSDNAALTILPEPASLRDGLVSYWPLQTFTNDNPVGITTPDLYSRNDMALVNMDQANEVVGMFGSGLSFNGTDEYTYRLSGFPIYINSAYSIALWVNVTGTGQSDRRFFSESSTNNQNPLFNLGTQSAGANGGIRVFIRNDAGALLLDRTSTAQPLDGSWHHIVWTETNGQGRLYVDGVRDAADYTYTRGIMTLSQTTLGGILRAAAGSWAAGSLDEVAVWNRRLTPAEIESIRTTGVPGPISAIPPAITQSPQSQSVLTKSTVTFTFTATGTSPLDFQWRKNGSALAGETNVSLVLSNATLGDAGDYVVVVTNSAGAATSEVATLTVTLRPPPPSELKVDFNNVGPENPIELEPGFSSFALPAFGAGPFTRSYGGTDLTLTGVGVTLESRKRLTPVNNGSFTEERLLQDFIFSRDTTPDTTGMDILLQFLETNRSYHITIWSFDSGSPGARISDWTANGNLVRSAWTFDGSVLPTANEQAKFEFDVTSDLAGTVLIQGRRNASTAGVFNVFANALHYKRRDLRIVTIELANPVTVRLLIEVLDPSMIRVIEQSTSLNPISWTEVTDASFGPVNGTIQEATFAIPDTATRFYRVLEVP